MQLALLEEEREGKRTLGSIRQERTDALAVIERSATLAKTHRHLALMNVDLLHGRLR